ncbi:hypothetical protein FM101_07420 [Arthrobacter rhombi]|uniref:Uncharacterized protein n=1 Tax=Arthrobacter rhombi TaxID=71253 RepID=A0A1R4G3H0_9MICC|nr:hypothetical protein FM101_07420 [Arthrobacter rhombi]
MPETQDSPTVAQQENKADKSGESAKASAEKKAKAAAKDPLKAAELAANVDGLTVTESTAPGKPVIAQFPIADHLSKLAIKLDAQDETIKILKAVRENVKSYKTVYVQGSFASTDDYGNDTDYTVLNVHYEKATVDKINFDGIESGSAWSIRDGGTINSSLLG